eukprot:12920091-Prorocentrum_lima.AAC.1
MVHSSVVGHSGESTLHRRSGYPIAGTLGALRDLVVGQRHHTRNADTLRSQSCRWLSEPHQAVQRHALQVRQQEQND